MDGCHNDWHTIRTLWTPWQEEPEEESREVKMQILQQCVEDTYCEEDLCKDKTGEDKEICEKLSVTLVVKRDI